MRDIVTFGTSISYMYVVSVVNNYNRIIMSHRCRDAYFRLHVHNIIIHNSYLPVIGVHSTMHLMHPNYWQITILTSVHH